MANVRFNRKELLEAKKRYNVIRDCLGGEIVIKAQGTKYLPMPIADSDDAVNSKRYAAYLLRAVFYNVTKRTLDGLSGQIFIRDPIVELPPLLQLIAKDADGGGVNLTQLAKEATKYALGYGRTGIFVDYPVSDSPATRAQLESGELRPTLCIYDPSHIINWRTIVRGAREILSLVVLEEDVTIDVDGFETKLRKQWRVLRLLNDVYTVEIYRDDKGVGQASRVTTTVPRDSAGNVFDEIPFSFIGATNNDPSVDEAPLYDIAALNIAHYRNSADYEESAFMVGQPTPVFSGLTQDWVETVIKGKVMLGSRGSVSLPEGGSAMLLQASPNSMPFEAMEHKEKQMVALGARLVEKRSVTRTATEINQDAATESSVLASAARNVAAAFSAALVFAGRFIGEATDSVRFELNTDFDISAMTPEQRRQLMEEWQMGAITFEEMRTSLRKSGIVYKDDVEARDLIEDELASMPENSARLTGGAISKGAGDGNED